MEIFCPWSAVYSGSDVSSALFTDAKVNDPITFELADFKIYNTKEEKMSGHDFHSLPRRLIRRAANGDTELQCRG